MVIFGDVTGEELRGVLGDRVHFEKLLFDYFFGNAEFENLVNTLAKKKYLTFEFEFKERA